MNFEFSIVCIMRDEDSLGETVEKIRERIADQKADKNSLEFLIYDTICSKASQTALSALSEAEKGRVSVYDMNGASMAACYNDAIDKASGTVINFTVQECIPGSHLINCVKARMDIFGAAVEVAANDPEEKECYFDGVYKPASIVAADPVQLKNGKRTRPVRFRKQKRFVNLRKQIFYQNLILHSYFFEKMIIGSLRFEDTPFHSPELFLIKLLDQEGCYFQHDVQMAFGCYLHRDYYNDPDMFEPGWYTESLKNILIPFAKEHRDSDFIKACVFELMQIKYAANLNDRHKHILSEEEIDGFFSATAELLNCIDDDIILQNHWDNKQTLQRFMGMNFIRLKYGDMNPPVKAEVRDVEINLSGENSKQFASKNANTLAAEEGFVGETYTLRGLNVITVYGAVVEGFDRFEANIFTANYENGAIVLDGELANVYFADFDRISLSIQSGDTVIPAERTEIYSYAKYFGRPVKKGYMFRVRVPLTIMHTNMARFHFEAEFGSFRVTPVLNFTKFYSKLHNKFSTSYWSFGDGILSYDGETNEYILERYTPEKEKQHEKQFIKEIKALATKAQKGTVRRVAMLRKFHMMTRKRHEGKQLWITFDQLFKGGDNGEYFFRYMNDNHPEIETCYVVNEDTGEYARLSKKYGKRVLKFKSPMTWLTSLRANLVLTTRADAKLYCGFTSQLEVYFRGMFNADIVCLQHGLSIQKIAQYQNRLFDNIKYYYCVSPKEVQNLLHPLYGYDESVLDLTGAPRYDGLTGKPKKQILITPTWRRNVTSGTNTKGKNHNYSDNFKHTVYYQIYNTLINDKRLIDCAKETGYRLIYLIHPILSPQAGDFDTNDYLEIKPGVNVNYEKILKESALMVTDYSGIQFDFAYMRRPLIYYHPDELPPQYEEAPTGFGPICKNNEEIVDALCRAMRNDCALEDEYKKNIEEFFPYSDQNNCKRCYEATMRFLESRSES